MRYFIHISTGSDLICDPEGAQFVDLAAAIAEASQSARDLIAEELRCGKAIPSRWEARIATADGDILKVLPFSRLIAADSRALLQPAGPPMSRVPVGTPDGFPAAFARAKETAERSRVINEEIQSVVGSIRASIRTLAAVKIG
jgi:hypothetical protein